MTEHNYDEATVRFYDVLYDHLTGIISSAKERTEMYLEEIAKAGGAVLEAGVGTGLVFVPALETGADIYGIDKSELMYNKVISKLKPSDRHRITLNDMRTFTLDKKFKLVISPFRVFQHMQTIDDQLSALNRIYEHLDEGGLYIFDLFRPNVSRLETEVKNELEFEGEYEPGRKVKRCFSVKPDYNNQVQNVTFTYVWDENGSEKSSEYSFPMRYFFRFEIENLIARTKFTLEKIYGGFDRSELSNESKEFIVVCRK